MKSIIDKILPKTVGFGLNVLSYVSPTLSGSWSLNLFCTPREGRILSKSREENFLKSCASTHYISTEGKKIKSYIWNETGKKVILLLHGWESNSARWRFLLPDLIKNDFKVVAIDAPAHGNSGYKLFTIPKYADAIDATVNLFQPNHIIGHSLGGSTLCYYLTHYKIPSFEKVILLGVPSRLRYMIGLYNQILGLSARTARTMDRYFEKKYQEKVDYFTNSDFCKKINIPTLVIHDKDDDVAMVEDGILYSQELPDSKLLITEKLGHRLQDPFVFSNIVKFLKGK